MKIEAISNYRTFNRNLDPKQMLGEIMTLIESEEYQDFIFIAAGKIRRSLRIGSTDNDLRIGDLLFLLEMAKQEILECHK
jgi:hypothetical protein